MEEGGRTGLTTVVTAGCFLLALFFAPVISAIPELATAPALVIVGVFMMQSVLEIDFQDFAVAVPAVLTLLVMPLAFSISEGIAVGFVVYAVLMLAIGRGREVTPLAYALAVSMPFCPAVNFVVRAGRLKFGYCCRRAMT